MPPPSPQPHEAVPTDAKRMRRGPMAVLPPRIPLCPRCLRWPLGPPKNSGRGGMGRVAIKSLFRFFSLRFRLFYGFVFYFDSRNVTSQLMWSFSNHFSPYPGWHVATAYPSLPARLCPRPSPSPPAHRPLHQDCLCGRWLGGCAFLSLARRRSDGRSRPTSGREGAGAKGHADGLTHGWRWRVLF